MRGSNSERGSTLLTVALMLIALTGFLALVVDVGMGYIERRRIQSVADAAALAGVQVLVNNLDNGAILDAVNDYALVLNPPAGNETRTAADVQVQWLVGTTPVGNVVRGGGRPEGVTGILVTVSGSTPTFFANLLGITTVNASASGGGGYSPLDVVLVFDRSTSMMYDSTCNFEKYFSTPSACRGVYDDVDTSHGLYVACDDCGGKWATPTRDLRTPTPRPPGYRTPTPTRTSTPAARCYWPKGGLMNPVPTQCATPGVTTRANCEACKGSARPWEPLETAKQAASTFIDMVQAELTPTGPRAGLVTYSTYGCGTNDPCQSLTYALPTVSAKISSIDLTLPTPWYYTNCDEGLSRAISYLTSNSRATAVKAIVFLTDGNANLYVGCYNRSSCSESTARSRAIAEASTAKGLGIRIYTIGLGTDADQSMLQQIATISGGAFRYAPTAADLAAVYSDIFAEIKRLRLVE